MSKEFVLKTVQQAEIYNVVSTLEHIDDCGFLVFKGFHYFSYNNIKWSLLFTQDKQLEPIFFLAYKGRELVGALKLGHYVRSEYDFWAVNFVDVHKNHRRKGVASFLYKQLNDWGKARELIVVGSRLSELGEKARMHELRKRILRDVKNYDSEEELHRDVIVNLKTQEKPA